MPAVAADTVPDPEHTAVAADTVAGPAAVPAVAPVAVEELRPAVQRHDAGHETAASIPRLEATG